MIKEVFRQYITKITDNPQQNSLHNFRFGGVSAAAINDISDLFKVDGHQKKPEWLRQTHC